MHLTVVVHRLECTLHSNSRGIRLPNRLYPRSIVGNDGTILCWDNLMPFLVFWGFFPFFFYMFVVSIQNQLEFTLDLNNLNSYCSNIKQLPISRRETNKIYPPMCSERSCTLLEIVCIISMTLITTLITRVMAALDLSINSTRRYCIM